LWRGTRLQIAIVGGRHCGTHCCRHPAQARARSADLRASSRLRPRVGAGIQLNPKCDEGGGAASGSSSAFVPSGSPPRVGYNRAWDQRPRSRTCIPWGTQIERRFWRSGHFVASRRAARRTRLAKSAREHPFQQEACGSRSQVRCSPFSHSRMAGVIGADASDRGGRLSTPRCSISCSVPACRVFTGQGRISCGLSH